MGYGVGDGIGAVFAIILIVCNLVAGCFYVAGFPVSYRMDTGDSTPRTGDYARYYYVVGVIFTIWNLVALVVSVVPQSIVQRVGYALVLIGTLISSFIMIQVQYLSLETGTAYPNCNDAPMNYRCKGDKLNVIATIMFMLINACQVAYAVLWSAEEAKKNAQK